MGVNPISPPVDSRDSEQSRDEFRMLSRELHDVVAQAIAAGLNGLELSEYYFRNDRHEQARAKWREASRTIRHALDSTKELAALLRVPNGLELRGSRRRAALTDRAPSPPPPGDPLDPAEVFLILREAILNAMSHSGAGHIDIRLLTVRSTLLALVDDDGSGVAQEHLESPASLGLQSMRERTARLGGVFQLAHGPGGGTRVVVTLPLGRV